MAYASRTCTKDLNQYVNAVHVPLLRDTGVTYWQNKFNRLATVKKKRHPTLNNKIISLTIKGCLNIVN